MRSAFFCASIAFIVGNAASMILTSFFGSSPWLPSITRIAMSPELPMPLVASTLPFQIFDLFDRPIAQHDILIDVVIGDSVLKRIGDHAQIGHAAILDAERGELLAAGVSI